MIVYVTLCCDYQKIRKKKKNIRNAAGKYNEKFPSIIFNKNYDEIKKFH
jgi:CRISPR/Cas system CMR-associated protein Cmr5 small subunit